MCKKKVLIGVLPAMFWPGSIVVQAGNILNWGEIS